MTKIVVTIEFLDGTTKLISPKSAQQLRDAWASQRLVKHSDEQQQYLDSVNRLIYGEGASYCFHRYTMAKTIPMRKGKAYVMKCRQCDYTFTTDQEPKIET